MLCNWQASRFGCAQRLVSLSQVQRNGIVDAALYATLDQMFSELVPLLYTQHEQMKVMLPFWREDRSYQVEILEAICV